MAHRPTLCASAVLGCFTVGGLARADNPELNVETFRPSPHARDILSTLTSDVPDAWDWRAAAWLSYSRNPLVFVDLAEVAPDHAVIADQLALHALGALALTDWLSVGLEVPVFLYLDGDDSGFVPVDPVPTSALGDVRLSAKLGIFQRAHRDDARAGHHEDDGFGLGLELALGLPTGDGDAFVSDGLSFVPSLALDYRVGDFRAALNVGARLRSDVTLAEGTELGNEFVFRVGAAYEVIDQVLTLLGEIQGASHDFALNNDTYVEGLIGGELALGDGFGLTLAGGRGLTTGYGSTAARVVLGFAYATPEPVVIPDSDGDGLKDDVDACVREPEDKDGFEDLDGCPDPDNDKDGVLDVADACPAVAEDADGFEDDDGCPDDDNDGDGVRDLADGVDGGCRNNPEDKDGFQDDDGCPDPDNDGDGLLDTQDDCPADPNNRCGVKLDACEIVIDQTIYFAYDDDEILPASYGILDALVSLLKTRDVIKLVEVQGHTDSDGDAPYNLDLSQRRAEAVVAYFAKKDLAAGRFIAKGYGETMPLVKNDSPAHRAENRRVQFIILDPVQSGCVRPAASPKEMP